MNTNLDRARKNPRNGFLTFWLGTLLLVVAAGTGLFIMETSREETTVNETVARSEETAEGVEYGIDDVESGETNDDGNEQTAASTAAVTTVKVGPGVSSGGRVDAQIVISDSDPDVVAAPVAAQEDASRRGDLVVTSMSWSPVNPAVDQADEYVYLDFSVKNNGSGPITAPTDTEFTFYKDSANAVNEFASLSIGSGPFTLQPGKTKTFSNVPSRHAPNILESAGSFIVVLVADSRNHVSEADETNNSFERRMSVVARTPAAPQPPALKPNISLYGITCPVAALRGDPMTCTIAILNTSDTFSGPVDISAFGKIETYDVNIAQGVWTNVTVSGDAHLDTPADYEFVLDPFNKIDERDEDDNTQSKWVIQRKVNETN